MTREVALKVYEGEWAPRDLVLLEFPSTAAWESFYYGPTYQGLPGHLQLRAARQRRGARLSDKANL